MSAGKRRSTIRPGEMLGIHRFNAESTTRSNGSWSFHSILFDAKKLTFRFHHSFFQIAGGEYLTMDYANHVLNLPYLIVYQWVGAFVLLYHFGC